MNMVDATNKRKKVRAMGRQGAFRASFVFYGAFGVRPGGMRGLCYGAVSNGGPGQVRTGQRRDLQDGSCC